MKTRVLGGCKVVDFLFLYEHKARELENCVYISEALRRRGYSTRIASMYSFRKKLIKSRVTVTPHLYDENQLKTFISSAFGQKKTKVIDMQYEQVLSVAGRKTEIHKPKGASKKAVHVAWGSNEEKEYINNGISPNNILRIGNIGIDFNSKLFRPFLKSRESLSNEYLIPKDSKWCLFLSSFTYCGRTDENLLNLVNPDQAFRLRDIMDKTQSTVLNWFERAIEEKDNLIFIYRKHPAETPTHLVQLLKERYPKRFFVIDDYTIRHWINVSDICYTWFSTSAIDAYFAGKKCGILRPFHLDEDLDAEHLVGEKKINTYEEFMNFNTCSDSFIGENLNIKKYLDNARDELVLDRYVDSFIKVLNGDKFYVFHSSKDSFRNEVLGSILEILCDMSCYLKLSKIIGLFSKRIAVKVINYEGECFHVNKEIKRLKKEINDFLDGKQR